MQGVRRTTLRELAVPALRYGIRNQRFSAKALRVNDFRLPWWSHEKGNVKRPETNFRNRSKYSLLGLDSHMLAQRAKRRRAA
jgi:hypothetical protein